MSTDDIAMLLGFSDPANFRRALKRWTGKGPRELRR
jgi:AraC-like DNA-binding protein